MPSVQYFLTGRGPCGVRPLLEKREKSPISPPFYKINSTPERIWQIRSGHKQLLASQGIRVGDIFVGFGGVSFIFLGSSHLFEQGYRALHRKKIKNALPNLAAA